MPTEFKTLVMRAKACHVDPRTGDVILTPMTRGYCYGSVRLAFRGTVEEARVLSDAVMLGSRFEIENITITKDGVLMAQKHAPKEQSDAPPNR